VLSDDRSFFSEKHRQEIDRLIADAEIRIAQIERAIEFLRTLRGMIGRVRHPEELWETDEEREP
jgi:hypothetical protein